MTKISLVQLSQLEVKPYKVKLDEEIYLLSKSGKYKKVKDNEDILLHHQIFFEDFNEPLIEIVEEVLLTDEDKECLRNLIKYCDVDDVNIVQKLLYAKYIRLYLGSDNNGSSYSLNKKHFKGLENKMEYKTSDLGLYDEE